MGFFKHLLPAWKKGIEDKRKANAAILASIDKELTEAEQEAIKAKVLMSLNTATGEWLDEYGKIFGVLRRDDETDDAYRSRIIGYILLERGTIPAIKKAIQNFLQDYDSHIEIYEPYTNVFFLNRSKLNGEDRFLGEYYTFAVIDIKMTKPFPEGLVDVINEFKPAGVTFKLSYRPNGYNPNASIVEHPLSNSEPNSFNSVLQFMNGMNDRIRGHVNLTGRIDDGASKDVFVLNDSKLNSLDVLTGSYTVGNPNYNLASFTTTDMTFTTDTVMGEVAVATTEMSEDFYTRTGELTTQYASHTLNGAETSYLHLTLDVATYLNLNYDSYLREIEPSLIYTKSTYMSVMDTTAINYAIKAAVPVSTPSDYIVQVLNINTGSWEDLDTGKVRYTVTGKKLQINSLENYLSESGLIFSRIKILPNAAIQSYPLHVHFFELGFIEEIAVRPTVNLFLSEVLSSSVILLPIPDDYYKVYDGGYFLTEYYEKTIDGGIWTFSINGGSFNTQFYDNEFDGGTFATQTYDREFDGGTFEQLELTISGGSFTTQTYNEEFDGGTFDTNVYDSEYDGGSF